MDSIRVGQGQRSTGIGSMPDRDVPGGTWIPWLLFAIEVSMSARDKGNISHWAAKCVAHCLLHYSLTIGNYITACQEYSLSSINPMQTGLNLQKAYVTTPIIYPLITCAWLYTCDIWSDTQTITVLYVTCTQLTMQSWGYLYYLSCNYCYQGKSHVAALR